MRRSRWRFDSWILAEIFCAAGDGLGAGGGAGLAAGFAATAVPFLPEPWLALPLTGLAAGLAGGAADFTGAGAGFEGLADLATTGAGLLAGFAAAFAGVLALLGTGLELLALAGLEGALPLAAGLAIGFDFEELLAGADSAVSNCCLDIEFQPAKPRPLASFASSSRL